MGILDLLLGSGSPITAVINKIAPDANTKLQYQIQVLQLEQQGEFKELDDQLALAQTQTNTNQTEATNTKLFVSGWRPFIGWICGTGLGWNYIGISIVTTFAKVFGHPVELVPMDISELMPLLIGMLGLGGMRTYEKINGVNSGN